jgi:hypothetical protein
MEQGKHMSGNLRVAIMIVALVAVAASAALLAALAIANPQIFPFRPVLPPEGNPVDIELFYVARVVVTTINVALLVVLVINYASIYVKTRSEFTIGLLIFAVAFLIKDMTSSPLFTGAFGFGLFGLGPFAFLPDLFELVALSVLVYLTVKY